MGGREGGSKIVAPNAPLNRALTFRTGRANHAKNETAAWNPLIPVLRFWYTSTMTYTGTMAFSRYLPSTASI